MKGLWKKGEDLKSANSMGWSLKQKGGGNQFGNSSRKAHDRTREGVK